MDPTMILVLMSVGIAFAAIVDSVIFYWRNKRKSVKGRRSSMKKFLVGLGCVLVLLFLGSCCIYGCIAPDYLTPKHPPTIEGYVEGLVIEAKYVAPDQVMVDLENNTGKDIKVKVYDELSLAGIANNTYLIKNGQSSSSFISLSSSIGKYGTGLIEVYEDPSITVPTTIRLIPPNIPLDLRKY